MTRFPAMTSPGRSWSLRTELHQIVRHSVFCLRKDGHLVVNSLRSHKEKPTSRSRPTWKRWAIQGTGWILLVAGIAALVLPGPGLLGIAAGLTLLGSQYSWAKRLLSPVKAKALRLAIKGVQTWPRIGVSIMGSLTLTALGIFWGLGPPAPQWWPLGQKWWLVGGWTTGVTLIVSGLLALALTLYSVRRFRDPSSADIKTAHKDQGMKPNGGQS